MAKFSKPIRITVYLNASKVFEKIFLSGPVVFGRSSDTTIPLKNNSISRQHCQVVEDKGVFVVQDLHSRNKIMVGRHKVDYHPLTTNTEFRIGEYRVSFEIVGVAKTVPEKSESQETIIQDPLRKQSNLNEATVVVAGARGPSPMATPALPSARPPSPRPEPRSSGVIESPAKIEAEPVPRLKPVLIPTSLHEPLVNRDFGADLLGPHAGVNSTPHRRLETVVMWHNQVYEVREFNPRESVTIGSSPLTELRIPSLKLSWTLAHVDLDGATCHIPQGQEFTLLHKGETQSQQDLIGRRQAQLRGSKYFLKISHLDVLEINLGSGLKVFLRYIPATKQLTKKKLTEPDHTLKKALFGSGVLHALLALLLIVLAPNSKNVPKLKNVPERFARLLVEPPKPIIPTPPPEPPKPPPEPEKPVVKKPEPRIQKIAKKPPEKKIEMKMPKKLVKQNKFPLVVKQPVVKAPPVKVAPVKTPVTSPAPVVAKAPPPVKEPPPVKLESVGALSALGSLDSAPSAAPVKDIQINREAGGRTSSVNTLDMSSKLPSAKGGFAPPGTTRVATKGKGIGTGTEYGTQGLKGGAGGRGIAAAVVGRPNLAQAGRFEGLTREQVMKVVQSQVDEVQHCYEKNLLANPELRGRMELEWDITSSGQVTDVRIKRSDIKGGDGLADCVKGIFRGMKFPRAKNGQSTTPSIGFPFGRL